MRRFTALIGLAAALALAAAVSVQAEVVSNTSFPISLSVFIPCANGGLGETVDLGGALHDLTSVTVNGNHVSGKVHDNPQDVTGVGQTSGDRYQGTGVTQNSFAGSLVNSQFEETFVNSFRIVSQGPGNNYAVHEESHLAVDANGYVTVLHDNFTVDCR